jgi:hypothetical protein
MGYLESFLANTISIQNQIPNSSEEELKILFKFMPVEQLWSFVHEIERNNLEPKNPYINLPSFINEFESRNHIITDMILAKIDRKESTLRRLWESNNLALRHKCLEGNTKFLTDHELTEILKEKSFLRGKLKETIYLYCPFVGYDIDDRVYQYILNDMDEGHLLLLKTNQSIGYRFFDLLEDLSPNYDERLLLHVISNNIVNYIMKNEYLMERYYNFFWKNPNLYNREKTIDANDARINPILRDNPFNIEWIRKILNKWRNPNNPSSELIPNICKIITSTTKICYLGNYQPLYNFFDSHENEKIREAYYMTLDHSSCEKSLNIYVKADGVKFLKAATQNPDLIEFTRDISWVDKPSASVKMFFRYKIDNKTNNEKIDDIHKIVTTISKFINNINSPKWWLLQVIPIFLGAWLTTKLIKIISGYFVN